MRSGVIWTGIGAAAGFRAGFAICPYCANEGQAGKFTTPVAAAGAGLGALSFLSPGYRTVSKQ
jgi:hypothetical protein